MILTVDVGNTNIVLGGFDGEHLVFQSRIATDTGKMSDEYAVLFKDVLKLNGCMTEFFDGGIISSVVPQLTPTLKRALKRLIEGKIIVVSPGIKTGLNIKSDNPSILGADLVCGAVGALKKYPMPCIVIDLGTSTTISALDKSGAFIGCSICPGVRLSISALSENAAQLPYINLEPVKNVIGTDTVECMKSGIIFGHASMLDGMIKRYKEVLGESACVVATGGLTSVIIGNCESDIITDENLLLDGLIEIYKKNS